MIIGINRANDKIKEYGYYLETILEILRIL